MAGTPNTVALTDDGTGGYVCTMRADDVLIITVGGKARCHIRVPPSGHQLETMDAVVTHVSHNNGGVVPHGIDGTIYAAAALMANGTFNDQIKDGTLDVTHERKALNSGRRRADTPPPRTRTTTHPAPQTPLHAAARRARRLEPLREEDPASEDMYTKYIEGHMSDDDAQFVLSDGTDE